MKRCLGIDYGEARIGVAASDDLGMLAHPLETIHVRQVEDPIARIAEIAEERNSEALVVGMPFRIDGTEGSAAAKVRRFIEKLARRMPEVEIVEIDERLSTVDAQARLHEAGRTVKNSRGVIDQAAAATILQEYLDAQSEANPDDWQNEDAP